MKSTSLHHFGVSQPFTGYIVTVTSYSACSLKSSEDLYPEPGSFRPARFLERKFSRFEYIPFGGGSAQVHWRCLRAL